MLRLTRSLHAWGTPEFAAILKQEIEQAGADPLPLQQGLSASSVALGDKISVMITSVSEDAGFIHARAGVFYSGVIAGCSCADDPTPVNENSEYCELRFDIDKQTAATTVTLLAE